MKKIKIQTILVLEYKKRNDNKIFHSKAKLTASDTDTDAAFKSMYWSILTKTKNYACDDCVILDEIIKHI